MRKSLLTLLVVCSFGVFTAMAQDSSSGASQTTTTTSTQSTPGAMGGSSGQSGSTTLPPEKDSAMSNGAMQTGNGTDQMLEGCLVKEQTAYYLQPETGGARTQLSPSRSLDPYVGQHIQVKGRNDGAGESATAASSSSGSSSAMSSQGELTVTAIKVVSATCSPTSGTMRQR